MADFVPDFISKQLSVLPAARNSTFIHNALPDDGCSELDLLDEWLTDKNQPISVVLAGGGVGKTTIVRHWLTHSNLVKEHVEPDRKDGYRLIVHSFYGQAGQDGSVVDVALSNILSVVEGPDSFAPSQSLRLERIIKAGQSQPFLLVLDGLETQQDKDGYIDAQSLPMDTLITRLAATKMCKILITSRRPLKLFEPTEPISVRVRKFRQPQVSDFIQQELAVSGEIANSYAVRFFPEAVTPLLISVFIDLVRFESVEEHCETIRAAIHMPSDPDGWDAVSALFRVLKQSLDPHVLDILTVVAISDTPIPSAQIGDFLKAPDNISSSLVQFGELQIALDTEQGQWDLHPKVRGAVQDVIKLEDHATYTSMNRRFAERLESEADAFRLEGEREESSQFRALNCLYRSLQYWLESDAPMKGINDVYIEKLSGDTLGKLLRGQHNWRSIRRDFAYRYESDALENIIRLLLKTGASLEIYYAALNRHAFVARALGDIEKAENSAKKLSDFEVQNARDPNATAQIILTHLMKGAVDLEPDDQNGAAYWVQKTRQLTDAFCTDRGALFPLVRFNTFAGAYYHRMNKSEQAAVHFEKATAAQCEMHAADPDLPTCLSGLNAFLYCWYLIEAQQPDTALALLTECRDHIARTLARDAEDPTALQWQTMADVTEAWVLQEFSVSRPAQEALAAQKAFLRSNALLSKLNELEKSGEFRIPFDMAVVHARAKARALALSGDPEAAVEMLGKQVSIYQRRHVLLYAADCQADILRTVISYKDLNLNWVLPTPVEIQQMMALLTTLTRNYPLGRLAWYDMPRLKSFRETG